jgi:(p)ppGpp synthase/HD superfamily hydrolase
MTVAPGIDAATACSALVRSALSVARRAHAGQFRDTGSGVIPFIDHPVSVAERLAENDYPEEVLAAGLLHDVVESGEISLGEVRKRFGDTVAGIVDALSERPTIESYEERKDELRGRVAMAGTDAQAVFAADKLTNVEVLRTAYALEGEEVDAGLEVSLDLKIYIWELDLEMLFDESPGVPIVDRLADEMAGLWGERAAEARFSSG